MKKAVLFALVFGVILLISGCNRDNDSSGENTKQGTKQNTKQSRQQGGSKKGFKDKKGKNDESSEAVVINVEAEKVFSGDAISVFKTTTILAADLESAVTSKASGIVLKINVEVGDKVQVGDVLAILESDLQQLRLRSATANYQKSLHNYDRAKILLKKGLANQESVDNLKFETKSLKTNKEQAQLDLDFTQIKASISGVITKRNIKKGNLIQVNTAVYQIVDFDSLQAIINVPENKWGLFKENLQVILEFSGIKESITAHILRIDPVVDSSTGTFRVVISINQDNQQFNRLRPGLFGKTKIVLNRRENTILISKNAIIREDNKSYVFVINDDNSVTKKAIKLGYEMPDNIEISEGLELGELLVTTGKNNVSQGSKVAVIEYND